MEQGQPREAVLRQLEESAGRILQTREDVRKYLDALDAGARARSSRVTRSWKTAKQAAELTLLLFAFLQYYIADVLLEIASLPQITVFVPVVTRESRSAMELLFRFV